MSAYLLLPLALLTLLACVVAPEIGGAERLRPAFQPRERTYNYAPCFLLEPAGSRLHVWYCANRTPGDVTDYLCYRRGIRTPSGWKWSEERVALAHGSPRTAWDSRHVCDPEVVAGRFLFRRRTWPYAMLYLGCDAERSTHNQIGVAFAQTPAGPWVRYPEPIIPYTDAPDGGEVGEFFGWPVYRFWGVGQPAAVSLDRKGKLLIFYSRGEQAFGEEMAEADLSNMDRGPILCKRERMPTDGLRRKDGSEARSVANIGVALDERSDKLFMVREELPPSDGALPEFIAEYVQVAVIRWSDLRRGAGRWRVVGEVAPATTGWPRNHNATIVKDPWGRLPRGSRLSIGISLAEAYTVLPPEFGWLWTYRIGLTTLALPNELQPR